MNVRLHIERLVLDGMTVSHTDRAQLVAAVESELSRLLETGGMPAVAASGFALPAVDGGSIGPTANPTAFGCEIARSVYRGLGGNPGER